MQFVDIDECLSIFNFKKMVLFPYDNCVKFECFLGCVVYELAPGIFYDDAFYLNPYRKYIIVLNLKPYRKCIVLA